MPIFDERFARQYRGEPPPEFPLASPYTGIDHHLSGTNMYAHTQTTHLSSWSVDGEKKTKKNDFFQTTTFSNFF